MVNTVISQQENPGLESSTQLGLFCVEFAWTSCAGDHSSYSGFLPESEDMHVSWTS